MASKKYTEEVQSVTTTTEYITESKSGSRPVTQQRTVTQTETRTRPLSHYATRPDSQNSTRPASQYQRVVTSGDGVKRPLSMQFEIQKQSYTGEQSKRPTAQKNTTAQSATTRTIAQTKPRPLSQNITRLAPAPSTGPVSQYQRVVVTNSRQESRPLSVQFDFHKQPFHEDTSRLASVNSGNKGAPVQQTKRRQVKSAFLQPPLQETPSHSAPISRKTNATPRHSLTTQRLPTKAEREKNMAEFTADVLRKHNDCRRKHAGTPALTWSDDLAVQAQVWADRIAGDDRMCHSPAATRTGQGENLAGSWGEAMTGSKATQQWYNEISNYNFADPKRSKGVVGHFTQVVWKNSKEVGAGMATSATGWHFVVARYKPAGNMRGAEGMNVLAMTK